MNASNPSPQNTHTVSYPSQPFLSAPTPDEHLGSWFKRDVFEPQALKAKDVAQATGIPASKLSRFLNQKVDLDNEMAMRLAFFFGFWAEDLLVCQTVFRYREFASQMQRDVAIINSNSAALWSNPVQANP